MGAIIDQEATTEDHMFLPENIFEFFEKATLATTQKPLIKRSHTLYLQKETPKTNPFLTSPLAIFTLLAGIILFITYYDFKNKSQSKWLDITIFAITGIIGILILLLWFATDHKGMQQNYNLLWACVLNILGITQLFLKKVNPWFIKYLKFLILLLLLLSLHWLMGVQVFSTPLIPFLVALGLRYYYLVYYYNKQITAL